MSKRNKEEKVVCLYFDVYFSRLLIAGSSLPRMLVFANTRADPGTQFDKPERLPTLPTPWGFLGKVQKMQLVCRTRGWPGILGLPDAMLLACCPSI